jgi:hypothetical protein
VQVANRQRNKKYNLLNTERNTERSRLFYESVRGRAKTLLKGAERRRYKGKVFDIDEQFVLDPIIKGVCQVTGLPFDLSPHPSYCKNPFSPSIDRCDKNDGYSRENSRIVIWQYNLMKGEMTDEEILDICRQIVRVADERIKK